MSSGRGRGCSWHDRGASADVLVVDDDELIRDVLSEALAATGYGVRTAANGCEALERVGEAIPDLIVPTC